MSITSGYRSNVVPKTWNTDMDRRLFASTTMGKLEPVIDIKSYVDPFWKKTQDAKRVRLNHVDWIMTAGLVILLCTVGLGVYLFFTIHR
jgi:hypothetical protein